MDKKVYYYDNYWCIWLEIVGYNEETQEVAMKRLTPINGDFDNDHRVGQTKNVRHGRIEMKFLSLSMIERKGKKYDEFCKEIFETCREAYRILHFKMNIPNKRFDKEGCIAKK